MQRTKGGLFTRKIAEELITLGWKTLSDEKGLTDTLYFHKISITSRQMTLFGGKFHYFWGKIRLTISGDSSAINDSPEISSMIWF